MELGPTAVEINDVFHRLRVIAANKTCFDCNAKNPTWASVTYGVFICIDCSAVHRSLGVHLTFVRSTQLDTNWTWVQLRQMQLGGNANASQFFNQYKCSTPDAQKKYNSRGAQLYRDKLHQLALTACKRSSELHLQPVVEEQQEEKEEDFFSEQEKFTIPDVVPIKLVLENKQPLDTNAQLGDGPTINLSATNTTEEHKSTITARKGASRKPGLGKKGGLGATRVKTNFAEIEKQATLAEESKLRAQEETAHVAALSEKDKDEREVAMRLAYKDLSVQQQQKEEQLKKIDPKKAEQLERLGMGVNTRTGISHSALSDMKTIEQENVQTTTSSLSSLGKLRISDNDSFFDDFAFSTGFSMNRNANSTFGSNKGLDSLLAETNSSKNQWVIIDDVPAEAPKPSYGKPVERPTRSREISQESSSDLAQKKFGGAKAISSDQFFDDKPNDFETQANLSRFQGSSSISSSDFFGNGRDNEAHNSFHAPDLEDVRESVRQGVTKVAGKLSSLANGVMSSLQEKYGY